MVADSAYPYDVTLAVTGGTTYGFMLSTPPGQSKQIEISEPQPPDPSRLSTNDIASMQDFDPKLDTPFAMGDFTSGVGQLEWDFIDDTAYWWSSGVVTHQNGKVYIAPPSSSLALSGATGALTGALTYLTAANVRYDFVWESVCLWRRDATNATNAWVKVYTAAFPITAFTIMDGIGLIATPGETTATTDFFFQSDVTAAATWTPTIANHAAFSNALGKPKFFRPVRGTCYAFVEPGKIFYSTTPTTDSWSGPIDTSLTGNISGPPGDDSYPCQGLIAVGDFMFVPKKDAIYSVDSQQDVIEVIWQWKDKPSEYNFPYFATGSDLLMYSVGPEVYTYDPTTGQSASTRLSRKSGFSVKQVLGVAADNQYMYVLARVRVATIRSADSVAIFRGVKTRSGAWNFEVIWEDTSLTNKTYGGLWAVPFGVGTRLYWGVDDAGDTDTLLMDIPAEWDETSSGAFATAASLWTSISRAGFPGFTKRHLYFNLNGTNLSSTNKVTVHYSTDMGANFTQLGACTADSSSFNYSNVSGSSIVLRFDFVSAGTVTPIIRTFDHHQRIRLKYLPQIKIAVRIANDIRLRNNSTLRKHPWEIWDWLVTLRTSNSEITYNDFLGNSFLVTVDAIAAKPSRHEGILQYEEEAVIAITRADKGA